MNQIFQHPFPLPDGRVLQYHFIPQFEFNVQTYALIIHVQSWVDSVSPETVYDHSFSTNLLDWQPQYGQQMNEILLSLPEWNGPSEPYAEEQQAAYSNQPSKEHVWDPLARAWIDPRPLAEVKAAKWEFIKEERAKHEKAPFAFEGHRYHTDMQHVNGAVTTALICQANGLAYTEEWTTFDNAVVTLTTTQVINLGLALAQYVSAIYATARSKRDYINSCATVEQVQAVTWESIDPVI